MNYLLDTCVISEFFRESPSENLIDWISTKNEQNLYVSVLTLGEIQQGISKLEHSNKRLALQCWLDNDVTRRFNQRLLSIDAKVMDQWGRLRGSKMREGVIIPVIDGLIAATAKCYGMTIVTRNVKDLCQTGAMIKNPW